MAAEARLAKAWSLLKEQALSGAGGHCALLDLSSRMAGFLHWHEAHERAKSFAKPAAGLANEPRSILIRLSHTGPRLGGGAMESLSPRLSDLSPRGLSDAMLALALSAKPPEAWSPRAWSERMRGFAAMLPEALDAMAALGEPVSVSFLASWEGISRARSVFDKSDPQGLGSRWLEWARPWHSVYAPLDSSSRSSYEPMALAWGRAERLAELSGRREVAWLNPEAPGELRVDPGEEGAWLALAKSLLRARGLPGELAGVEAMSPEDAALGLSFFSPAGAL